MLTGDPVRVDATSAFRLSGGAPVGVPSVMKRRRFQRHSYRKSIRNPMLCICASKLGGNKAMNCVQIF